MKKSVYTYAGLAVLAIAMAAQSTSLISPAVAKDSTYYTGYLSNVAVQGYDPVAYFTAGQPVKGDSRFSATFNGAEFHFSSQAHLDQFKQDPESFAPQYGGYCAWAVSQGYTAKGDAKHWRIIDGKLYLNYSAGVQKTWETDIPGFIEKANANWPGVVK